MIIVVCPWLGRKGYVLASFFTALDADESLGTRCLDACNQCAASIGCCPGISGRRCRCSSPAGRPLMLAEQEE